jgi:hypothetical protein
MMHGAGRTGCTIAAFASASVGIAADLRADDLRLPGDLPSDDQPATPVLLADEKPPPGATKFVHNRDSDPRRPPVIVLTDGRYELSTKTDFDTSDGSIQVTRSGISNNLVIGPEHDLQISIPVDYEVSHYRFRGQTGLTPDGRYPLLDAEQWFFAPNVEAKIDDTYGLIVGGLFSLAGQEDLSKSSFAYGGFAGVRYKPSDSLTIRAVISGISQIEDDPIILPGFQFEWKLDERTRLAAEGPELRLEYDMSEAWTVKLGAAWESRNFRLDDNAPLPNGVFEEQRLPVTLRLEYCPHAALRFEVWGGVQAYQHYQTVDEHGVKFRDERADPAAILGISFEVIF